MNINKIIKSTILNVDSSTRVTAPKYIYKSDGKFLPNDPLYFYQNNSEIKISYPNHQLLPGDNIIIQNVQGPSKILYNSFYLFNNFNYLVINYQNHNIPSNYKKYTNQIYININLYGDTNIDNIISNIPLNSFIGIQQVYIYTDIINSIPSNIANYLQTFSTNDLLFIKLDFNYLNIISTVTIPQSSEITENTLSTTQLSYVQIVLNTLQIDKIQTNQIPITDIKIINSITSQKLSQQILDYQQKSNQTILNQSFSYHS